MTLASENFAIECCVIVFPVPKPPGMAAVPPLAIGKTVSRTLCPVTSGWLAGSLLAVGLGIRIGHFWASLSSLIVWSGSSTVTIVSFTVYLPSGITFRTVACVIIGVIIDLWTMDGVSGHSAITAPPHMTSPSLTFMVTSHSLSGSSESTATPLAIYLPDAFAIASSGLSIPSKMLFRIPGPSVMDMASPVP